MWPDVGLQGRALHDHIGFGLLRVLLVLLVLLRLLLLRGGTYGTSVTPVTVIISVIVVVRGTGVVVYVFDGGRAVFRINYWARWRRLRRFDQLDVMERVPIVRGRRPRAGGQGHADHAPGQCQAYAWGHAYGEKFRRYTRGRPQCTTGRSQRKIARDKKFKLKKNFRGRSTGVVGTHFRKTRCIRINARRRRL